MTSLSLKSLRTWLSPRSADAHKGDFGHVLIVAGSRNMTGAAILAARAALRSGCGLTSLALPAGQQAAALSAVPEAMTLGLPETSAGTLRADAVGVIQAEHTRHRFTVLAAGPGLTTRSETARAVIGLLGSLQIPTVLDADALNILALQSHSEVQRLFQRRHAQAVITPHLGEAARLLRKDKETLSADRSSCARMLAQEFGCVALLKGRGTVVTDGRTEWVNPTGNPGLAKGGSGDVLTGLIAGLWAQLLGMGPEADGGLKAAVLGAYLHGLAADIAVKDKGPHGMLATDIIAALPRAYHKFKLS